MIDYELVISVVSHNQGQEVGLLLDDIEKYCKHINLALVLTLNSPENITFKKGNYSFRLEIISNDRFMGFAANHNRAYKVFDCKYFCVLNPDIRLMSDPFEKLFSFFEDSSVGVVAPAIISEEETGEDSIRFLPLPHVLPLRLIHRKIDYESSDKCIEVDWAAGMFLLFDSKFYSELKGFDEKYYLYCEDIDICSRAWLRNRKVICDTSAIVMHKAQRKSRKKIRYFIWHIKSYLKLFTSSVYYKRLIQKRRK